MVFLNATGHSYCFPAGIPEERCRLRNMQILTLVSLAQDDRKGRSFWTLPRQEDRKDARTERQIGREAG